MARGENTGSKKFLQEVKNPLDDAMNDLKKENRDYETILYRINYARDHINNHTSTMGKEIIEDFNRRIKITTSLLGVSSNNIDKAYELVTQQTHIQYLSKKLTADVTPTLNYAESNAKNTGIESIESTTTTYKEEILAAINDNEKILTEIDNRLNKLGYVEHTLFDIKIENKYIFSAARIYEDKIFATSGNN